jgi:hypothetical protein
MNLSSGWLKWHKHHLRFYKRAGTQYGRDTTYLLPYTDGVFN